MVYIDGAGKKLKPSVGGTVVKRGKWGRWRGVYVQESLV